MEETIVFTGGGSGGHVFPGLAVIEELRGRHHCRIVWIGSKRGIERGIIEAAGLDYVSIPSGKFRRYLDIQNVLDVFRVAAGLVAAIAILRKLRPTVVFSKGGYVSVPVVVAARILRIQCITHESDVDPGLATRINARFADAVLLAYEQAAAGIGRAAEVTVTGNPVRRAIFEGDAEKGRSILAAERLGIVFFVGGSLGARQINLLVAEMLDRLLQRYFVIHQCGKAESDFRGGRYLRRQFIREEYPHFLAAADLVVCRAGANTLWELSGTRKPSILIPLDSGASRGDQLRNAEMYRRTGAALVHDGADAVDLFEKIDSLMKDAKQLNAMAEAAWKLGGRDAAGRIADRILKAR